MSARRLALALILLLQACRTSTPPLTIHLRCGERPLQGSLSIARIGPGGDVRAQTSSDLRSACAAAKVELSGYDSSESLKIVAQYGDGRSGEIIARYGPNIQRDQQGFFTVVKLTPDPPYIANDSI